MDAVIVTCDSARDLHTLLTCDALTDAVDRLVVVDNASRDDSVEMARDAGAEVVLRNEKAGYGAAVNLAVRHTRGDRFLLLNPDVRACERDDVDRLSAVLDADPEVAIVAPGLRLPDGELQDSARQVPTPLELVARRAWDRRRGAVDVAGRVPWVVGACALIRRSAFDAVGGFDERYRLYFEDVDLCVRLGSAGWSVSYRPDVVFEHDHHAASRQSLLGRETRMHTRSALQFFARHPRSVIGADRHAAWVAAAPRQPSVVRQETPR